MPAMLNTYHHHYLSSIFLPIDVDDVLDQGYTYSVPTEKIPGYQWVFTNYSTETFFYDFTATILTKSTQKVE
eukprot:scaffold11118_cov229-Skeletonema_marinoi.AAC.1